MPNFANIEKSWAKFSFRYLSGSGRRRLWNKLAKLISNGVPILVALETIHNRRVAAGAGKQPLSVALSEWISGMHNGERLSVVIGDWVSDDERMLIAAGEKSGTVEKSLLSAARVMEAKNKISMSVIGGLAYPFILVILAFCVLYLFGFKIVPAFSKIAPPEKWSGVARLMIEISMFAQKWLLVIAAVIGSIVAAFFFSLPRWDSPLRIKLDRYAPYSVYRVMYGSSWLIAFAALIESGVRVENALQDLSATSSPWLKTRIDASLRGIRSGLNVGESLARSGYEFPDREIIDDLGVYSSLSGFDQALLTLGREWLDESVVQIKARMAIVFGVCLLLLSCLVAFMVSGMMSMQLQMAHIMQNSFR